MFLLPAFIAAIIAAPPQRHWAFAPVRPVAVPTTGTSPVARHPVDAFLGARTGSLSDRRTLIRRATFDLLGLPPTPEEIDAFLNDASPDAYEKLIDRLLASPHYGEKWGRAWLDVVRYADTAGETADFPAPHAWRYRNYVIDSFNKDKPYDQFLREQVAGDLIAARQPERHAELVTATGFLAISRRFGYDIEKDHFLTIEDTLDTLGKAVLGLTIACARCHDHKYDPVSNRDYYALYGIFDSTRYPFPGCEKVKTPRDTVPLMPPAEYEARLAALRSRVETAAREYSKGSWINVAAMRNLLRAQQRLNDFPASVPQAYAVAEGKPHHAAVQQRGDPESPGAVVPRGMPAFLGGRSVTSPSSGREELAAWLTDPKNPLTARVMVNRLWQGHFGTGIVPTPNDFGTRGAPPTHPQLLDWLAGRFVASGWSVKAMHRLLMTSEAYRRGGFRRRLTGEEVRDALLAVSGELDRAPGGPHPFPDPKTWNFTQHGPFSAVYEHNKRSVYLMTQRIKRHPFLALFDGPDPNASTGQRFTTTVPTQALYFLNDPFVHARAAELAKRLAPLPDDEARLRRAGELLYGRPPTPRESEVARRFLAGGDWPGWLRVMLAANEFVYVD